MKTIKNMLKINAARLAALLLVIASAAAVKGQGINTNNMVQNGGFEMGSFTDWTLSGNIGETMVDDGSWSGIPPHSGNYEAILGQSARHAFGYLSPTSLNEYYNPGQMYTISFWVNNMYGDPNVLRVSWDGTTILSFTNLPATGWINVQTNVFSSGSDTLQFTFQDSFDGFALDDVSVMPLLGFVPFTYTTNNGTINITGYTGPGGVVSIPSTINGYSVTSINGYAFQNCSNVTAILIPSSVNWIGGGVVS